RNRAIERRAAASAIERDGQEVDIPCERCWNVKPWRHCIIVPSSNKCSGCVRLGKKYSSPNIINACKSYLSSYRFRLIPSSNGEYIGLR
ncbi:hypothetical protein C8A01DRAFT_21418, partial [Parachaetomium inaequale]